MLIFTTGFFFLKNVLFFVFFTLLKCGLKNKPAWLGLELQILLPPLSSGITRADQTSQR